MTQYDQRITTYFGDSVLRAGFMPVPHLLMRHYHKLGLSAAQAMFVLQIMESNWDLGEPPRTVGALAERMGVDARTIRKYTEEVRHLGLIQLYNQFDDRGAQVENGYDLSPLFQRIAALVPEPKLPAAPRRREPRGGTHVVSLAANGCALSPAIAVEDEVLPLGSNDPRVPDSVCRPLEDPPFLGARITRARLNTESKTTEKTTTKKDFPSQPQLPPCPSDRSQRRGMGDCQDQAGQSQERSLRWNVPLDRVQVAITRQLLDQFGMKRSVAAVVAPTLHPAEAWALWVYARGARLTPGWIANQLYDFRSQQPRIFDLSSRYDDAGHALTVLDQQVAEQIVELIDQACPAQPEVVVAQLAAFDAAAYEAGCQVWRVMAELRGGTRALPIQRRFPQALSKDAARMDTSDVALAELWEKASDTLRGFLPSHDWETWLHPCRLLDLQDDYAVVGTPNIFVREEVNARYLPHVVEALGAQLGRPVTVEVVIGDTQSVIAFA